MRDIRKATYFFRIYVTCMHICNIHSYICNIFLVISRFSHVFIGHFEKFKTSYRYSRTFFFAASSEGILRLSTRGIWKMRYFAAVQYALAPRAKPELARWNFRCTVTVTNYVKWSSSIRKKHFVNYKKDYFLNLSFLLCYCLHRVCNNIITLANNSVNSIKCNFSQLENHQGYLYLNK